MDHFDFHDLCFESFYARNPGTDKTRTVTVQHQILTQCFSKHQIKFSVRNFATIHYSISSKPRSNCSSYLATLFAVRLQTQQLYCWQIMHNL